MKASELRIGNLVYQLGYDFIQDNKFLDGTRDVITVDLDIFSNLDIIAPIKLLDEWLLKLGFKYRNEHRGLGAILDFKPKEGEDAWKYSMSVAFVCVKDKPNDIYLSILAHPTAYRLIYVHQLQNLYFAITGEELTLK